MARTVKEVKKQRSERRSQGERPLNISTTNPNSTENEEEGSQSHETVASESDSKSQAQFEGTVVGAMPECSKQYSLRTRSIRAPVEKEHQQQQQVDDQKEKEESQSKYSLRTRSIRVPVKKEQQQVDDQEEQEEEEEEDSQDQDDDAGNVDENEAQQGIQCNQCNRSFSKQSNLNAHIKSAHLQTKYLCPDDDCSDDFTTSSSLRRHLKRAHKENFEELNPFIPEQEYILNKGNYIRSESANLAKIKRLTNLIAVQDEELDELKEEFRKLSEKN
ncbi:UPF0746 protein DDB_G0281095-like [Sitodiplosis mosellana]|uniref:UPF0746 protein DDB_G0281095-like n=1 Tax=Sitodiplosis mosellana TaxID=263140 RepID=UPI00244385DC|nr:UPF0746 protein DDB_G0281095-like [Sitodiplosis mosellana]